MDSVEKAPSHDQGRVDRKRTERISRLERAAARVFATRGYDGANFDHIGAELDLRGPSLYHYFESKEALFVRSTNRAAEEVFERLGAILDMPLLPAEKFRALIREQVLIVVVDYPEFVPLFFKTQVSDTRLADHVLSLRRRHAAIFEPVAEAVCADGEASADAVRVWLAMTFGALSYLPEWFDPTGPMSAENVADVLADMILRARPR